MFGLGSIISALIAAGTAVAGGVSAHRANKRAAAASSEAAASSSGASNTSNLMGAAASQVGNVVQSQINSKQAYDRQRSLWSEQFNAANQYNSPVEQRKRLEAAGLNPYLNMDKIATGNITSALPESAQSPAIQANTDPMTLANVGLMSAQARNLDSETDKNIQDTRIGALQEIYDGIRNQIQEALGMRGAKAQVELTEAQTATELFDAKLKEFDLNSLKPAQVAQLAAQSALAWAQKANVEMHTTMDKKMIASQIAMNYAMAELHKSATRLNNFDFLKSRPAQISLWQSQEEVNSQLRHYYLQGANNFMAQIHRSEYLLNVDWWCTLLKTINHGTSSVKDIAESAKYIVEALSGIKDMATPIPKAPIGFK